MKAKGVLGEGRIYKLPGRRFWMLDYFAPNGTGRTVRVRESSQTEDEELAKKRLERRVGAAESARRDGAFVETPTLRRVTVAEVLEDYLRDLRLREMKGAYDEKFRLGKDSPLQQARGHELVARLELKDLENYAEQRRAKGKSNATINRDLEGLRSALRRAHASGKLVKLPTFPPKLREKARTGFYSSEEVERLCQSCPGWLSAMVRFAFATGWRRGELLFSSVGVGGSRRRPDPYSGFEERRGPRGGNRG